MVSGVCGDRRGDRERRAVVVEALDGTVVSDTWTASVFAGALVVTEADVLAGAESACPPMSQIRKSVSQS